MAVRVRGDRVHVPVRFSRLSAREGEHLSSDVLNEYYGALMQNEKAFGPTTPPEQMLGDLLSRKGLTIAVAESCTGGLISHRITNIPGASGYFLLGTVAYSNECKVEQLGVDPALLEQVGAVSRDVALAMACGIKDVARSDIGVGVTGIAGPEGETPDKPVGLVFIAAVFNACERVERHVFDGTREAVKQQASDAALTLILEVARGD
jgi:nicotinamide-nucleotide amidase